MTVAGQPLVASGISVAMNSLPVPVGANFEWRYTATLKSGSTLNPGDFFTIYDIAGFGPSVPIANPIILPANWSSSVQPLGINGFVQTPTDSGTVNNVTYTYIGASAIVAAGDTILASNNAFGFTSSSNALALRAYSATSHVTAGGAAQGVSARLRVPGPLDSCIDVDGNGAFEALSDGLILVRALFGLTGNAVTNSAVGAGAARSDWTSIRAFLNGNCGTRFPP